MSESSKQIRDKFKDTCRVCAKKSTKTMSLFGIRKKGSMLADMLSICTQTSVRQTNFRPSNICNPCLSNLEIAFDFYNQVKLSENNFKIMVSSAVTTVNEEEKSLPIEFCTLNDDCSIVQKHLKVEFSEGNPQLIPNQRPIEQKRIPKPKPIANETIELRQMDVEQQIEMHKRKMNRLFECFLCKAKLKSYNDTRAHLRRHNEATPFKCRVCAMNFSAIQLEQHLCKGRSIQCVYCLESFETTINLLNHLECHREQHILHKCTDCSRLFPMIYLLECHQVQHLQVEKPYICQICNRGFRVNFALTKHLSTHSNERRK